jgi:hypothetical protein
MKNKVKDFGDHAGICLYGGNITLVDWEDLPTALSHHWRELKYPNTSYAICSVKISDKWTTLRFHRFIMGVMDDLEIDHVNGCGLDNRRANLRVCTSRQNKYNLTCQPRNKHGLRGVAFEGRKRKKQWEARICTLGVTRFLGRFHTKQEAAQAYLNAAKVRDPQFHPRGINETNQS